MTRTLRRSNAASLPVFGMAWAWEWARRSSFGSCSLEASTDCVPSNPTDLVHSKTIRIRVPVQFQVDLIELIFGASAG